MTHCPIDKIFVEIKIEIRSAKFRNLGSPDALKLYLKKKISILFSEEIYLLIELFCFNL